MNNQKTRNENFEAAQIRFRNLSGLPGNYNPAGQRSFALLLSHEDADRMADLGWNIKMLNPREEGDLPQPYIKVKVSFQVIPPKIMLVKRGHLVQLSEETVGALDFAELENVDLTIRPYHYDVNGSQGITAYLKTMYVTMVEDEFESKYADVMDSAQTCIGPDCPVE